MERIRYRFFGHVQHRGFRYACLCAAEWANLVGWVRNEEDGSVLAEAQGTPEAQLAFVMRLSDIVGGLGYDWTVASEERIAVVDGERRFSVVG